MAERTDNPVLNRFRESMRSRYVAFKARVASIRHGGIGPATAWARSPGFWRRQIATNSFPASDALKPS